MDVFERIAKKERSIRGRSWKENRLEKAKTPKILKKRDEVKSVQAVNISPRKENIQPKSVIGKKANNNDLKPIIKKEEKEIFKAATPINNQIQSMVYNFPEDNHYSLKEAIDLIENNKKSLEMTIHFLEKNTDSWTDYKYIGKSISNEDWRNINNWELINQNEEATLIDGGMF